MHKDRLGKTQQKVLLLLRAGVALSLMRAKGVRVQVREMEHIAEEWRELNRASLVRAVGSLYHSKLVRKTRNRDGTLSLVLTEAGAKRVLRYNVDKLAIKKPKRWDGKWRMVLYDIPEPLRDLRYALLHKLKHLGFVELQHSVFVHPYECRDEIEFLIEAYDARPYVRRVVVDEIDTPEPLLKHFKLARP